MRQKLFAFSLMCLLCVGAWAQQRTERSAQGEHRSQKSEQEETVEISFDVKLADFMSRENVWIQINGYAQAEYDEASGLFKANVPVYANDTKERSYVITCNDYRTSVNTFPKTGQFTADKSQTITVDMTGYHQVSFSTNDPDNWELSTLRINLKADVPGTEYASMSISNWGDSEKYYMEAGEYEIEATVSPKGSSTEYIGGLPQTINFGTTDTDIIYEVHPENYHQVLITATDRDGNTMSEEYVSLYSLDGCSSNHSWGLQEEGKATFMLHDGKYSYLISKDMNNSTVYCEGEFTVAGKDMTVNATMGSEWLKLTVKAVGDLLADFTDEWTGLSSFYLRNPSGFVQMYLDWERNEDNTFSTSTYLNAGMYEYRLDLRPTVDRRIKLEGKFQLNEDYELVLDMSSDDYGTVSFEVLDVNGNPLEAPEGTLSIIRQNTSYHDQIYDSESPSKIFYLTPGDYYAVYRDSDDELYINEFTITSGGNNTVTIQLEKREYATVTTSLKLPQEVLSYYQGYGGGNCQISFYEPNTGYPLYDTYIDLNSPGELTASIELPKGTYTYDLWPGGLNRKATIDIQEDTELSFDFTNEPYLHITLTDEAGIPLNGEDNDAVCYIYQDGQEEPIQSGIEFFGFLEPGTYNVWVEAYFYTEDNTECMTLQQTVTMGTSTQEVDIVVPKPDPDNFAVVFDVDVMDVGGSLRSGSITLNGMTAPLSSYVVFGNIPAGNHPYTIEAEGYETYTGTVEVNESVAGEYREVDVQVYLTPKTQESGIDELTASDRFRIYPTVAEDVVHIAPAADVEGSWTVRLVSASGMVVYADKHDMSAKTAVPVAGLPKGLYLLCIDNGVDTETYKVVKK